MSEYIETSWSGIDDHHWRMTCNLWWKGSDWCIEKIGKQWSICAVFPNSWPLYNTRRAAMQALDTLMERENQNRCIKRIEEAAA